MNDLISVIMPVYNVETYLPQSIESVLHQDHRNLELILIDDGSPDGSGAICDAYAAKDNRVRVIHQQNGGAAAAKNAGLKLASGTYLSFVDSDDFLEPNSGEIWLAVNAIGVSNYTTDGNYWLEKKVGSGWSRLGDENQMASWGDETIKLSGKTAVCQVDWSDVYGELDAGVYRMGKHFYNGSESIIQYAEFAIYRKGGVFGQGGEDALARVDAAIDKLQNGNYRVEEYNSPYSSYGQGMTMVGVIWKYGSTMVTDYHNNVGNYSHSVVDEPGDFGYGDWLKRTFYPSEYDCIYFPEGYGLISDREIRFAYAYSQEAADNPCTLYTYRFDENGNLVYILKESCDSLWGGFQTLYVVTDTPEAEIQSWVAEKKAQ